MKTLSAILLAAALTGCVAEEDGLVEDEQAIANGSAIERRIDSDACFTSTDIGFGEGACNGLYRCVNAEWLQDTTCNTRKGAGDDVGGYPSNIREVELGSRGGFDGSYHGPVYKNPDPVQFRLGASVADAYDQPERSLDPERLGVRQGPRLTDSDLTTPERVADPEHSEIRATRPVATDGVYEVTTERGMVRTTHGQDVANDDVVELK